MCDVIKLCVSDHVSNFCVEPSSFILKISEHPREYRTYYFKMKRYFLTLVYGNCSEYHILCIYHSSLKHPTNNKNNIIPNKWFCFPGVQFIKEGVPYFIVLMVDIAWLRSSILPNELRRLKWNCCLIAPAWLSLHIAEKGKDHMDKNTHSPPKYRVQ